MFRLSWKRARIEDGRGEVAIVAGDLCADSEIERGVSAVCWERLNWFVWHLLGK